MEDGKEERYTESSPTRHEDRARARETDGERGCLPPSNDGTTLDSVEGGQPQLNVRR